ncbi:Mg/Co/Ni transporter MgtE [Streptacidiphilus sp. MAP12-16]|uniref:hypothetical protein n=1 Tax=Streptacidiphilus sp. MAP12-16 TaxID=3156300 RepID=UPI0035120506
MSADFRNKPLAMGLRALAVNAITTLGFRFGSNYSWATSLTLGAVLAVLTGVGVAYMFWEQRHPEIAAKKAERAARRAAG